MCFFMYVFIFLPPKPQILDTLADNDIWNALHWYKFIANIMQHIFIELIFLFSKLSADLKSDTTVGTVTNEELKLKTTRN